MRSTWIGAGVLCLAAGLGMIVFRGPLTERTARQEIDVQPIGLSVTLPGDNTDAKGTLMATGLLTGAFGVGLVLIGLKRSP